MRSLGKKHKVQTFPNIIWNITDSYIPIVKDESGESHSKSGTVLFRTGSIASKTEEAENQEETKGNTFFYYI